MIHLIGGVLVPGDGVEDGRGIRGKAGVGDVGGEGGDGARGLGGRARRHLRRG